MYNYPILSWTYTSLEANLILRQFRSASYLTTLNYPWSNLQTSLSRFMYKCIIAIFKQRHHRPSTLEQADRKVRFSICHVLIESPGDELTRRQREIRQMRSLPMLIVVCSGNTAGYSRTWREFRRESVNSCPRSTASTTNHHPDPWNSSGF